MSTSQPKTSEHRSRELMNLVAFAGRCATLAQADEAERRSWDAEVRRALDELHALAGQLTHAHSPARGWVPLSTSRAVVRIEPGDQPRGVDGLAEQRVRA